MRDINAVIAEIDRLSCDLYDADKRLDAIYLAGVVRGLIAARDKGFDALLAELQEKGGDSESNSASSRGALRKEAGR